MCLMPVKAEYMLHPVMSIRVCVTGVWFGGQAVWQSPLLPEAATKTEGRTCC